METFVNSGLWDEARVFTGNVNFTSGIKAPAINGRLDYDENITGDGLNIYIND